MVICCGKSLQTDAKGHSFLRTARNPVALRHVIVTSKWGGVVLVWPALAGHFFTGTSFACRPEKLEFG
jgi:hypothetical protein